MNTAQTSQFIRTEAQQLGFELVSFSKAEFMEEEARMLEQWLQKGLHGTMSYMENHFEMRVDPRKLVPNAKSIVSLIYNYHTPIKQNDPKAPKVATYAYGRDYHKVIRKKLKILLASIREEVGEVGGRGFVDSAPILERDWAKRSGLGWVGKNTLLINPRKGSNFFLAELVLDLELDYNHPIKDYCGTCTKCIDACPTEAISPQGYILDGSKCISYLTIELKEAIPKEFEEKMDNWMFGCDICQDVCPWNRFSSPHEEVQFNPSPQLLEMEESEWKQLSEAVFDSLFFGSAVKRTGFSGLKRNIAFLQKT